MKLPLYIAALLAGISLQAKAETIVLEQTVCGAVRNCMDIANSAGADIDILASTAYQSVGIYINGVGPYVGPYVGPNSNGPLNGFFYTVDNRWVELRDVTFSSSTRVLPGRGRRVTTYTLESGTVVTP